MFEGFTGQARTAIVLSQSYARMLQDAHHVGTQHLLLGLVLPDTIVALALADIGVACDEVRRAVFERGGVGTTMPPGHIPFTPRMQRVLENSLREAAALEHDYVSPAHLLLALLSEPESTACQILADQVGDLSRVRSAVLLRLAAEPPTEAETRLPGGEIIASRLDGSDATDHRPPRPATSTDSAQWLADRIHLTGQHWVSGSVGSGFAAYARVLHPLDDHQGSPTWAAMARANGRTMHPSVRWEKIISASDQANLAQTGFSWPGDPSCGNLPTWALEALCAILAEHTATPQACYFALYEHSGPLTPTSITARYAPEVPSAGPAPVEWQLDPSAPTFSYSVPRPEGDNHYPKYYLYEGHVGDAVRIGRWLDERRFYPQTPDFCWPADHAWRVATGSHDSTIIGGSRHLIDELCASKAVEVLQIAPDASYEDHINM